MAVPAPPKPRRPRPLRYLGHQHVPELNKVRDAVGRLHAHRVTYRGLTADRILLTDDGQAMSPGPGDGDVAASDLQIRLDLAQLIAELALVGPDRAAGLVVENDTPEGNR